ncbi:MAG: hypothetical protein QXK88_09140 [Desulfurococcaceae archaeon]
MIQLQPSLYEGVYDSEARYVLSETLNECYEDRRVYIHSPSKGPQALIGFKVRVKLRISVKGLRSPAKLRLWLTLDFETTTPQLLMPRGLAEELAIWPACYLEPR